MSLPVILAANDVKTILKANMIDENFDDNKDSKDVKSNLNFVTNPSNDEKNQKTTTTSLKSSHDESVAHKMSTVTSQKCMASNNKNYVGQCFTVQVKPVLAEWERVGLTGDGNILGNWKLDRSLELQCSETNNNDTQQWSITVSSLLNDAAVERVHNPIRYRYFIYRESSTGHKQIKRWETHLNARQLTNNINGDCSLQIDHFGQIPSSVSNNVYCNRGWITNEYIIQLKFIYENMFKNITNNNDGERIDGHDDDDDGQSNFKVSSTNSIYMKLMPIFNAESKYNDNINNSNQNNNNESERNLTQIKQKSYNENDKNITIEVSEMIYGGSALKGQDGNGVKYCDGNIVIFHVTTIFNYNYSLIFYNENQDVIGQTEILSTQLIDSEGLLELAIKNPLSLKTIAHLTLPYVIVRPYRNVHNSIDFSTTFINYWQDNWPNLHVGHRGNGKSYISNPPIEPENTIASFLCAYNRCVDMVELDVHLTADGIPVVYHDFGLRTISSDIQVTSSDQLQYVLIKDVNYDLLKQMRVFAIIDNKIHEYPSHNAEIEQGRRLFPTLMEVFNALPHCLGIDVEIKWPQMRENGEMEAEQTIDKNYFVDQILETVIAGCAGRPLLFSSFDADICTMLRFKQSIYPIIFLTMGETKKWSPFKDLRTRTFERAINNAQAFDLAGTAPHAEDFLQQNDGCKLIKKAFAMDQLVLVWGDACNSAKAVQYFQDIGASAICYDRADIYVPANKVGSFFNTLNKDIANNENTIADSQTDRKDKIANDATSKYSSTTTN